MPSHFSEPQPKAGRSTYPDLVSPYFRRLEEEMEAADSIVIMGHGKVSRVLRSGKDRGWGALPL